MKKIFALVAVLGLLTGMLAAALWLCGHPPTGTVTGKLTHPESFPPLEDTPTLYCLQISQNGKRYYSWYVSHDTYDMYLIGDAVGSPSNTPLH